MVSAALNTANKKIIDVIASGISTKNGKIVNPAMNVSFENFHVYMKNQNLLGVRVKFIL